MHRFRLCKIRKSFDFSFTLLIALLAALTLMACGNDPREKIPADYRITVDQEELDFETQLMLVLAAIEIYRVHVNAYPPNLEALFTEPQPPYGSGRWRGPYLTTREVLNDPWGRTLEYTVNDQGIVELRSLGRDGQPSDDDIAAQDLFPQWAQEMRSLAALPTPTPWPTNTPLPFLQSPESP